MPVLTDSIRVTLDTAEGDTRTETCIQTRRKEKRRKRINTKKFQEKEV